MELTQQNKSDLLEIAIVLAMFFLIVVIYVPVAIWEEETYFEKESRYRMQNLYDVETFYSMRQRAGKAYGKSRGNFYHHEYHICH